MSRHTDGHSQSDALAVTFHYTTKHLGRPSDNEQLSTTEFVSRMADTLAVMHWKAKLDTFDAGFVVSSAPDVSINTEATSVEALKKLLPGTTMIYSGTGIDFEHRMVGLWVVDFNECNQETPCKELGVDTAVRAFVENVPYFPRPSGSSCTEQSLALGNLL